MLNEATLVQVEFCTLGLHLFRAVLLQDTITSLKVLLFPWSRLTGASRGTAVDLEFVPTLIKLWVDS